MLPGLRQMIPCVIYIRRALLQEAYSGVCSGSAAPSLMHEDTGNGTRIREPFPYKQTDTDFFQYLPQSMFVYYYYSLSALVIPRKTWD